MIFMDKQMVGCESIIELERLTSVKAGEMGGEMDMVNQVYTSDFTGLWK